MELPAADPDEGRIRYAAADRPWVRHCIPGPVLLGTVRHGPDAHPGSIAAVLPADQHDHFHDWRELPVPHVLPVRVRQGLRRDQRRERGTAAGTPDEPDS